MGFLERITIIKNLLSLTDYAVEARSGLSNGSLQKTNNPRIDKIEKLLTAYPQISAEWLITGNGEPLKNEGLLSRYTMKKDSAGMVGEAELSYQSKKITEEAEKIERLILEVDELRIYNRSLVEYIKKCEREIQQKSSQTSES